MEQSNIICCKCNVALVKIKSKLTYMSFTAKHEFLRCPICGQFFIPEDLVKGKMKELEMNLEDK